MITGSSSWICQHSIWFEFVSNFEKNFICFLSIRSQGYNSSDTPKSMFDDKPNIKLWSLYHINTFYSKTWSFAFARWMERASRSKQNPLTLLMFSKKLFMNNLNKRPKRSPTLWMAKSFRVGKLLKSSISKTGLLWI